MTEDFALMEASYAIIRILQTFLDIKLPASSKPSEEIGGEKQKLGIVVTCADGCKVQLR